MLPGFRDAVSNEAVRVIKILTHNKSLNHMDLQEVSSSLCKVRREVCYDEVALSRVLPDIEVAI